MPTIDIRDAKFSELIDAVENGQEFILEDAGKPVARLIPITANKVFRKPGAMRARIKIFDDFDAPLNLETFMDAKKD